MSTRVVLSRRRFLQLGLTAGGALLVGFGKPAFARTTTQIELIGEDLVNLTGYVMIERDNGIVIGAVDDSPGAALIIDSELVAALTD